MRNYSIYFYFIILLICLLSSITTKASEQIIGSSQSDSDSHNLYEITHTPRELVVRLHSTTSFVQFRAFSKKLGAASVSPVFPPTTPAGRHPLLNRIYLVRFPTTVSYTHPPSPRDRTRSRMPSSA